MQRQLGMFMGILIAVSAVIIALIIYTLTMDKLRSIATLKLIGAPDRTIIGLIVQQALVLGICGLRVRRAADPAGQGLSSRAACMVEPRDLAILFVVVVVVCLLGSVLGVRAAVQDRSGKGTGQWLTPLPPRSRSRASSCAAICKHFGAGDTRVDALRGYLAHRPCGRDRRPARAERIGQEHTAQRDRLRHRTELRLDAARR